MYHYTTRVGYLLGRRIRLNRVADLAAEDAGVAGCLFVRGYLFLAEPCCCGGGEPVAVDNRVADLCCVLPQHLRARNCVRASCLSSGCLLAAAPARASAFAREHTSSLAVWGCCGVSHSRHAWLFFSNGFGGWAPRLYPESHAAGSSTSVSKHWGCLLRRFLLFLSASFPLRHFCGGLI